MAAISAICAGHRDHLGKLGLPAVDTLLCIEGHQSKTRRRALSVGLAESSSSKSVRRELERELEAQEAVHSDGFAGAPSRWRTNKYEDRLPICIKAIVAKNPSRVLDVGAGDGRFLDWLSNELQGPAELAGIELNSEAVEIMREKGYDAHVCSASSEYPFKDAQFDVVFAGEVIEHVFDPDAMLTECRRVLKPSGTLVITTPNLLAWHNRVLMLLGITPFFVEHSYVETYGPMYSLLRRASVPVGHLRIYNLTPLKALLKRNGFAVKKVQGFAFLPIPGLFVIDRAISRSRPALASGFIVTAVPSS
jgi:2-polyprenyl-3-methyl-5-hydroxy-6-metoxy-1,4-benzoquinol methylase